MFLIFYWFERQHDCDESVFENLMWKRVVLNSIFSIGTTNKHEHK